MVVVAGIYLGIRQVAASAAGSEYLFSSTGHSIDKQHLGAQFSGGNGCCESSCASSDDAEICIKCI